MGMLFFIASRLSIFLAIKLTENNKRHTENLKAEEEVEIQTMGNNIPTSIR